TGTWLNVPPREFNFVLAGLKLAWSFLSARTIAWAVPWVFDLLAGAAYVLLVVLVWRERARVWFTPRRRLLWLWLLAPIAGRAVFDLWRDTYVMIIPRYALAGMRAALLLAGLALARLGPWPRAGLLAALGAAYVGGIYGIYQTPSRQGTPLREVGRF